MTKRFVQVTMVGFFELKDTELEPTYEAATFEEAVEKQRKWHEDDPGVPFEEVVNTSLPIATTFELMPEDFFLENQA